MTGKTLQAMHILKYGLATGKKVLVACTEDKLEYQIKLLRKHFPTCFISIQKIDHLYGLMLHPTKRFSWDDNAANRSTG